MLPYVIDVDANSLCQLEGEIEEQAKEIVRLRGHIRRLKLRLNGLYGKCICHSHSRWDTERTPQLEN